MPPCLLIPSNYYSGLLIFFDRVLNHHYEELTDYSQIPERAPADSLHRVPEYEELRPDQEESQRSGVGVYVQCFTVYSDG